MIPDLSRIKNSYKTRQASFHKLLEDTPDEIWNEKLPGSTWPISHNLWHITLVQTVFTHAVHGMRQGRNYPLNGKAIVDLVSTVIAYRIPSKPDKQKVKESFDNSLTAFLAILDDLDEDEWDLPGKLAGKEHTIFEIYRGLSGHIDEHMERVQEVLSLS